MDSRLENSGMTAHSAERTTMKQLHQGLDYTLYKIYVWGGLVLLVASGALTWALVLRRGGALG